MRNKHMKSDTRLSFCNWLLAQIFRKDGVGELARVGQEHGWPINRVQREGNLNHIYHLAGPLRWTPAEIKQWELRFEEAWQEYLAMEDTANQQPAYVLGPDNKSIHCLLCGFTSHNENDVANRYCSVCKVFHEDEAQKGRYCVAPPVYRAVVEELQPFSVVRLPDSRLAIYIGAELPPGRGSRKQYHCWTRPDDQPQHGMEKVQLHPGQWVDIMRDPAQLAWAFLDGEIRDDRFRLRMPLEPRPGHALLSVGTAYWLWMQHFPGGAEWCKEVQRLRTRAVAINGLWFEYPSHEGRYLSELFEQVDVSDETARRKAGDFPRGNPQFHDLTLDLEEEDAEVLP